jgi:hypothetical protein
VGFWSWDNGQSCLSSSYLAVANFGHFWNSGRQQIWITKCEQFLNNWKRIVHRIGPSAGLQSQTRGQFQTTPVPSDHVLLRQLPPRFTAALSVPGLHARPMRRTALSLSPVAATPRCNPPSFTLHSPLHEDSHRALYLTVPPSTGLCRWALSAREAAPRAPTPPSSPGHPIASSKQWRWRVLLKLRRPPPRAFVMPDHADPPPAASTLSCALRKHRTSSRLNTWPPTTAGCPLHVVPLRPTTHHRGACSFGENLPVPTPQPESVGPPPALPLAEHPFPILRFGLLAHFHVDWPVVAQWAQCSLYFSYGTNSN